MGCNPLFELSECYLGAKKRVVSAGGVARALSFPGESVCGAL